MQAAGGASLSDAEPDDARAGARRRAGVLLVVAAVVAVLDQAVKAAAVQALSGRAPVELLGGLLTLRLVRNPGAAFGIAGSMTLVFSLVAMGVIVAVLRSSRRLYSLPWALVLGLLLGGAAGNLVDRLLRAPGPLRGHVVDMLELPHWPVFNVADMAIVASAVAMVLLTATGRQVDGSVSRG